jgi:hypothetical protein
VSREFQIGDLVTWNEMTHDVGEHMITGVVIGFKKMSGWELDNPVTTEAVVVHWNGNVTTNSSPLVLRKL